MSEYGQPILSFRDERALGWVALLTGLLCLGGGGLLVILVASEGVGEVNGDALAGLCLVVSLLLFGAGFSFASLRDVVGKPEWHVSSTHAVLMRGGRAITVIPLREVPSATVVDTRRNGVTVYFQVQLGPHSLIAPSKDAARRIAELWADARRT